MINTHAFFSPFWKDVVVMGGAHFKRLATNSILWKKSLQSSIIRVTLVVCVWVGSYTS